MTVRDIPFTIDFTIDLVYFVHGLRLMITGLDHRRHVPFFFHWISSVSVLSCYLIKPGTGVKLRNTWDLPAEYHLYVTGKSSVIEWDSNRPCRAKLVEIDDPAIHYFSKNKTVHQRAPTAQ